MKAPIIRILSLGAAAVCAPAKAGFYIFDVPAMGPGLLPIISDTHNSLNPQREEEPYYARRP